MLLGALVGFRGGRTDYVIRRFVDALAAFPALAIALMLLGFNLAGR